MPEAIVNEKDVQWIRVAPGMAAKMLALDKETKTHAILERWDPRALSPGRHKHPCLAQMYVLEGGRQGCCVSRRLLRFVRSRGDDPGGQGIFQKGWRSLTFSINKYRGVEQW